MRLPGTFHCKGAPEMVQCFALAGMGQQVQAEQLDLNMWDILPSQAGGTGDRIPVGEGERAPTTKAAADMLYKIDVANITDRNQWAAIAGAFMQSVDPADMDFALMAFLQWNESYPGNDPSANIKLWNDLLDRGTSVKGWGRLHKEGTGMTPQQARLLSGAGAVTGAQEHVPVGTSDFGPILDSTECAQYFDGCVLISSENVIFTPKGMKYPPEKFNATFGGKAFIITQGGKTTDEPWKAVTRSQLWMVPKVEYTCFRPDLKTSEITTDELGRNYVNTYLPANIARLEGDPTPFLNHLIKLFPVEDDREILIEYLAHNAQFPGHKIPWAPLIQSGEGAGKNAIKKVLRHVIGQMYFYEPKARDLLDNGTKFNRWMEGKVFFLVDEIRTDDKREMVEVLKPFITEKSLEIQGKGADQRMGDTPGNWLFFSNWKDAIPITANNRRHAIFYSAIQGPDDLIAAGMDKAYFDRLYNWFGDDENGGHRFGLKIVANYLMQRNIKRGGLSERAPRTSSFNEAIIESRGPLEQAIAEAVECKRLGFKGGWISTKEVATLWVERSKPIPATNTLSTALRNMGYHKIGRVKSGPERDCTVWHNNPNENLQNYHPAQCLV